MDESMDAIARSTFFRGDMKSLKLVLLTVLVAGCAQVSTPSNEVSTQVMNTATPTAVIVPSPSHTPIPMPTGTPTLVPTLPVESAQTKLLDMLSNNSGCRLPCLWGITPGESNYQEAQAILMPLSSISELSAGFLPQGGAIFPVFSEGNLKLSLSVGFNVDSPAENEIVSRIGFNAREFIVGEPDNPSVLKPVYDSNLFGERLRPFMLSSILSEYGIPAAVLISTDGGPERGKSVPGFYIVLFYPDQGIMVAYTTNRQLAGGNVSGCPANAHVEMELSPTRQPDTFEKRLAQTKWGNLWPPPADSPYWKPIEEAASMTLDQFYQIFLQPTNQCIKTPAELWPTPEP